MGRKNHFIELLPVCAVGFNLHASFASAHGINGRAKSQLHAFVAQRPGWSEDVVQRVWGER